MHTVITVTLNPCIDKAAVVERLVPYELNRIKILRTDPGGKGINVAHILRSAGVDVLACGFLAGRAGGLREILRKAGIAADFLEVEGETRINLKLLDESAQKITEITEPGFSVPPQSLESFLGRFASLTAGASAVVLSGSLPPGVPATVYRDCIRIARLGGARAILDADGEALTEGVADKPFAVKPNTRELERLVGRSLTGVPEILAAARGLIEKGVELVLVSMGAAGALVLDRKSAYRTEPWDAAIKSPTGAGDAMVGALAFALLENAPLERIARLTTAAGTATAELPGTGICSMEQAARFAGRVKLTPLPAEG